MVAVIAVTLSVEVPIDNKIKTWTAATLPSDWQDIRARWAAFHTLRTFLSLAAVAAAVGAALTTRPARGPDGVHTGQPAWTMSRHALSATSGMARAGLVAETAIARRPS